MQSLLDLLEMWPTLDEYHREGLRDFFARWTHSWANFSETLPTKDKEALLSQLDQEVSRRVAALKKVYQEEQAPAGE